MSMLPGLCFDATGTLIELTEDVGEVYRRVALRFGVDLPAWRLDDAFRRVLARAGMPVGDGATAATRRQAEAEAWSDLIRQTFQATDSTVRFDDFPEFAKSLFEYYAGSQAWRIRGQAQALHAALAALGREGFPMAVVSNFDHRLPRILQALGIKDYFDDILIPCDTGCRKPHAAVFDLAARQLDRPRRALVYIGDDPSETLERIAGLGVRTIAIGNDPGIDCEWTVLRERLRAPASV